MRVREPLARTTPFCRYSKAVGARSFFSSIARAVTTLLIGAASTVGGCNKPKAPSVEAPALPLDFQFAGCKRVWSEHRCELDDERTLTIWLDDTTPSRVSAGETVLAPHDPRVLGGGFRGKYHVPLEATQIVVERGGRKGALSLEPNSESSLLARARVLRNAGKWTEARGLLEGELEALTPLEATRARAMLARLRLADGDTVAAVRTLEQTAAASLREQLLSEAAYDKLAVAFVLTNKLHDFARAREVLDQVGRDFARLPGVDALLPYYRAVLALQIGEQQTALLHLKEAIVRAERLDLRNDAHAAKKQLAVVLHSLGRHREATELQRQLTSEAKETTPCVRLGDLISLSWFLLNSDARISPDELANVLGQVTSALEVCPDPAKRRNHQLNLVYEALREQHWALASQRLAHLASLDGGKDNRLIIWEELFRGQYSAGQRRWREALSHFARSESLAIASSERALVHAAKLARARVLEQKGDLVHAVAALEDVERLADELVRWVPLGEGQQMFALQLEGGTQSLIRVLQRQRKPERAVLAARRGRLRLLGDAWRASKIQSLHGERRAAWEQAVSDYRLQKAELDRIAARDWELSRVELDAAIRHRDVLLQELKNTLGRAHAALDVRDSPTSHVAPDSPRPLLVIARDTEQWHAFVGVRNTFDTFPLGSLDVNSAPRAWATALAPALERVLELSAAACATPCAVGVIVHPLLEGLDIHAMMHRDAPLLTFVPVVYLLDDWTAAPRPRVETLDSALIVGDPSGDLPVALTEARAVAARPLAVHRETLFGSSATRQSVLAKWRSLDLFHFSGHAEFGGIDGLESSLRLANDERLTLADALTAEGAPRFAVLSACDAGRARTETESGLGMSHALVAAGSEVVVAPSRVVPDAHAEQFATALYAALSAYSIDDWARAVKDASLSLRAAAVPDWAAYRVHASR